jgi:hypothetical protein
MGHVSPFSVRIPVGDDAVFYRLGMVYIAKWNPFYNSKATGTVAQRWRTNHSGILVGTMDLCHLNDEELVVGSWSHAGSPITHRDIPDSR